MELYDKLINDTLEGFKRLNKKNFQVSSSSLDIQPGKQELILLRDAEFELGGNGLPSVNYTCFTDSELPGGDEIILFGKDLCDIGSDCAFARIVIVCVDDCNGEDSEKLYRRLKDIEFVKYHVFPEGYMQRLSPQSYREQVRVSKKAVSSGVSFAYIGNCYLQKYKECLGVRSVKIIFVTSPEADFKSLGTNAAKADKIISALSSMHDNAGSDCMSCNFKEICDEVEGLRKLHLKAK